MFYIRNKNDAPGSYLRSLKEKIMKILVLDKSGVQKMNIVGGLYQASQIGLPFYSEFSISF